MVPAAANAPDPLLDPGITILSVNAPNSPVSAQGVNVLPNPALTGWNIIPMGGGTFQFVSLSLSSYHTLNGSMGSRIQNRASGQLWGVPGVPIVPGALVTLADPGAGPDQLWFTS